MSSSTTSQLVLAHQHNGVRMAPTERTNEPAGSATVSLTFRGFPWRVGAISLYGLTERSSSRLISRLRSPAQPRATVHKGPSMIASHGCKSGAALSVATRRNGRTSPRSTTAPAPTDSGCPPPKSTGQCGQCPRRRRVHGPTSQASPPVCGRYGKAAPKPYWATERRSSPLRPSTTSRAGHYRVCARVRGLDVRHPVHIADHGGHGPCTTHSDGCSTTPAGSVLPASRTSTT